MPGQKEPSRPLVSQPPWVTPARPRQLRRWTPATTVWVTTWGDRVHLYPDCPGTSGFGSDGDATEVRLDDRLCAARSGCLKCFGTFFNGSSMAELKATLVKLHGKVDEGPGRRTRSIIADKIKLRGLGSTQQRGTPSGAASGQKPRPAVQNKAALKRERDRVAAVRLGVSVEELKARRRAEHDLHIANKKSPR